MNLGLLFVIAVIVGAAWAAIEWAVGRRT